MRLSRGPRLKFHVNAFAPKLGAAARARADARAVVLAGSNSMQAYGDCISSMPQVSRSKR